MKKRLEDLKLLARRLEPGLELRQHWMTAVNGHAQEFLQTLATAPAYKSTSDEGKGILSSGFKEEPDDLNVLLNQLAEHVETPGVKLGSPGFFAFIPISSLYPAALGDYLAAVVNPFSGNFFASPGAVRLEHLLTRWLAEIVGFPKTAAGDLTSGGSISNLGAILTAREQRGLQPRDYERAVVYLSSETHHSVSKALRITGLTNCMKREIPLDSGRRMRADLLRQAIEQDQKGGLLPWLVVASAGSTDTGAVDPLNAIAEEARQKRLWLHVDGAYGAMFALCPAGKQALSGMDLADSLTLDPHKGLFMPCGSGALLVRQGEHLRNAYHYDAHYMQDRQALASLDEISPSELSPELTRPFRGLRLWLSLRLLGLQVFRAALEEKLLLAQYFYEAIRAEPGFEVGPRPALSILIFRYLPAAGDPNVFNLRLLRELQKDGRVLLSSTSIDGQFWIRFAVLCAATHREHVDLALELLRQKTAALSTGAAVGGPDAHDTAAI